MDKVISGVIQSIYIAHTRSDRPMSLCLKVRMKSSLCLKGTRNGIQVSQDYGVSISGDPGLWVVPGLAARGVHYLCISATIKIIQFPAILTVPSYKSCMILMSRKKSLNYVKD